MSDELTKAEAGEATPIRAAPGHAQPGSRPPLAEPAAGGEVARRRRTGLLGRRGERIARWAAVAAFLAAWQASQAFLNPIFISSPQRVATALFALTASGTLPTAFLESLAEMVGGLAVATVVGVGVGLLMGRIRLVERALDPLVAFGNATPSIALLPIMEVWFGVGSLARVAFIMVICTWPILVNTLAGVRAVRGNYGDVGSAFGLSGWMQTWKIYLPATVPFIFVGMRIALAVGAVGMILGGQEIGEAGLGGLSEIFGSYSQTADLIATIATTAALALFLFWGLRRVQMWRFAWIAETSAGRRGG